MQLKKLTLSFYHENTHLKEALDNHNGQWEEDKVRGYGVVIIELNNLTFAIPLRSHIRHQACYITKTDASKKTKGKGLDFSKALLIENHEYISNQVFKIPSVEHTRLQNKTIFIAQKFEKYVQKYIKAVQNEDNNILNNQEYRFTTLINYHKQLNIYKK